ncbi:hypothetical protein T484DRAFT_1902107 [Baffinella frigidus]|nr:hypothetical protein T484DRAFT_1902107 [Cryptophyta sp. CCMP2293]
MRGGTIFAALLLACVAHGATGEPSLKSADLLAEAEAMGDRLVQWRRNFHEKPELMYDLPETAAMVQAVLTELGIPFQYPVARSGVVGTIGTGQAPVVALRSDMDALPVLEEMFEDTKGFLSKATGKMHACGHDAHMAMLLGAAKLLKAREASIKGTVRLVFQPAEEGGAGGFMMTQEGVLDNPRVQRMFGMHVWPWLASGHVATAPGPLMAAAGTWEATITGVGGHAAAGIGIAVVDPVVATSAAITALHSIVSRDVRPGDSAVVSVTMVNGGHVHNVIPQSVTIGGTLRAFSREVYSTIERRTKEVLEGTAKAYGCTVTWAFTSFADDCMLSKDVPAHFGSGCTYPPVVNDADFSELATQVSPFFKMDESVLPTGAALHASVALEALSLLGGLAGGARFEL